MLDGCAGSAEIDVTYLLIGAALAAVCLACFVWLSAAWRDIVKAQERRRTALESQRARFSNARPAETVVRRRKSMSGFGRR